jgi:hypothetical protein
MPIRLPSNFEIGAKIPIDTRLVLTKSQMLSMNDNTMPSVYFALCNEDNAFYLYSKNNTIDKTTGKFRYMFDQEGPNSGITEERVLELISENAASEEDMQAAQEQLNAILDGAPADCDTFAEVAAKFNSTPDTAISNGEIEDIFG